MSGYASRSRSEPGSGPTERRLDRLVVAQVHVTVLAVAAAPIMVIAAQRLMRLPGVDNVWGLVLVASGLISSAAGLAPWASSLVTVRLQRLLLWSAIALGSVAVIGAIWAVELWALLGIQIMLAASALAELGTQRRAVVHFWISAMVLVGTFWLYYVLVAAQPRIN